MSTVDLTKVAGFKAVDAEGNDMGVVSLSEMTNMVKESIVQEAVAMQSVSTLAETSTLAATDTYEDRLPTSDTFSYVRTLDSSGNPKRTSSSAFASVVGGLIGVATKDKQGLVPAGYAPLHVEGTLGKYIKIGTVKSYYGHTVNVTEQSAGQQLCYGNYIIQIAGGSTDLKATAQVTKIIEGPINAGNNPNFYILVLGTDGAYKGCEIYCSSRAYQNFYFTSPTGFPFELSKVDLPSNAELISKK